jgi:hypothetical protein
MRNGLELAIVVTICMLFLAVTVIDLTDATTNITGVKTELNSYETIIPFLLLVSLLMVALGLVFSQMRRWV